MTGLDAGNLGYLSPHFPALPSLLMQLIPPAACLHIHCGSWRMDELTPQQQAVFYGVMHVC